VFNVLVDTCVWLDLARDTRQAPVIGVVEQMVQRKLLIVPRLVLDEFGALLQALIAREPVEQRLTIRAWLPSGFVPPQVTILSARSSAEVLMVRLLRSAIGRSVLSSEDVLYWRGDIF
jgi:hypothetical protein